MSKATTRGIRPDRNGWRVFQRVHTGPGGLKSKRFPKTATEREMREWQEEQRVEFRKARKTLAGRSQRGTLAADIVTYLKLVATMPSYNDRARDLAAWAQKLGTIPRPKLTANDFRLVLQEWRLSGGKDGKPLAASTVNHRRTAMEHLYAFLDGKAAHNPLRDIKPFSEPDPEPRDIGLPTALAIINKMPPSKTRARIKVLAWTGIRGRSEFGRMKRAHVNLEAGVCWVPTGKKGQPREVPLNTDGIAAWQEVIDTKAFGTYQKDSLRKSFLLAVEKVNIDRLLWFLVLTRAGIGCELQPLHGVRVYDLRHTIATTLRRRGADLADVQNFLGHTTPRMTKRYAPYFSEKLRRTVDQLATTPVGNPPPSNG